MRPSLAVALVASAFAAGPAAAQAVRPRSTDYLFVATADDARALWVNPAGLGVVWEASVLAELVVENPDSGSLRLAQWTVGFNSRGLSIGYQRDRHGDDPATPLEDGHSTDAVRFGAGFHIPNGAIGGSFTFYRPHTELSSTQRGGDLGLRYRPLPRVDLAVVLRNIGRPLVRDSIAPLTATLGVGWLAAPSVLQVGFEASAAERPFASGYDITYRGGVELGLPGALPLGAVMAFDFANDFAVTAWAVGVSFGGPDRLLGTLSGRAPGDAVRIDRFGLTGIASRRAPGRRP